MEKYNSIIKLGGKVNEYKRKYPLFSLCGLNCGLCPHYQCEGKSKCPGCGGKDFCLQHPSCAVINCNKRHDSVEFCFQCSSYPCEKYAEVNKIDSFITYQNVKNDFEECSKIGIEKYIKQLDCKIDILEFLLKNYNNGRLKNFYCLAVNLFKLEDLEAIISYIKKDIESQKIDTKKKIEMIVHLFETKAKEKNIILKLRK